MRLADVMQQIADRLDTIHGLRVFGYPEADVPPPAAVVGYPEAITPESKGRGLDSMTVPLWVVAGKVSERTTRDRISQYVDSSGPASVVAVLESGTYTAFDTIQVTPTGFDTPDLGGEYLAATFDVEITGSGR